jgi:hypothetical protein
MQIDIVGEVKLEEIKLLMEAVNKVLGHHTAVLSHGYVEDTWVQAGAFPNEDDIIVYHNNRKL